MSLTDIHIYGFRSVHSITFPVRRLSVLVGANGVGKTNLYRALELAHAAARGDLALEIAREGGLGSVMWAGERRATDEARLILRVSLDNLLIGDSEAEFAPTYGIEIGFGDSKYEAVFALEPQIKAESLSMQKGRRAVTLLERKGGALWYRDDSGARRQVDERLLPSETALSSVRGTMPEIDAVRHALTSWRFYHSFRTDKDAPLRRPALAVTAPMLDADGGNLGAVLATLVHIRGDTTDLDAAIEHAFPGAQLNVPPPDTSASFTMRFPDTPKREFGPHELSDGTLQFLALMGALLSYRLPPLIALNEPETSLHPDLLPALARIIAKAAQRTQIWVVTHSRVLADALAAETGVLPRNVIRKDGGTWLEGLNHLGMFAGDEGD